MRRYFKKIRNNKILQVLIVLSLAFFLYTMGLIGMIVTESGEASVKLTPLTLILSLLVVMLYAEFLPAIRTILIFLVIAVSGYLIEALGVNTGKIFGTYVYGKTLGLSILNTPVLIGLNWLFLVYVTSSLFEKYHIHQIFKIILASLAMVVFDLVLEPVAPKMDMWYWKNSVIPLRNYMAWFIIAIVFHSMIKLSRINTKNPIASWVLLCQFLFFLILNFFLKQHP
jgi:uncharacterized membrane protein